MTQPPTLLAIAGGGAQLIPPKIPGGAGIKPAASPAGEMTTGWIVESIGSNGRNVYGGTTTEVLVWRQHLPPQRAHSGQTRAVPPTQPGQRSPSGMP